MSPNTVNWAAGHWALFLDVDGTLLEIAETPTSVHVPEAVKRNLVELCTRLDGALALVSGRDIADLDRLFAPLRFCAAGVHGSERREPSGCISKLSVDPDHLGAAREVLARFAQDHRGLLLEDKKYGLALHYRLAPDLREPARQKMQELHASLGPEFILQAGKCVFELRPVAASKGIAISSFMKHAPFVDRIPIFLGDDVTDEDGFVVVNRMGGISIKVGAGAETAARYHLPGVPEVIQWLEQMRDGVGSGTTPSATRKLN
jgi:trehalose 6-phosphate phosphatase